MWFLRAIKPRDLNGQFAYILGEHEHHASLVYPGVKVGSCERAAGHTGPCEMFVDGTGMEKMPPADYMVYWIAWQFPGPHGEMAEDYDWTTSPHGCREESGYGWACGRPADHEGGHVFTVETL